MASAESRLEAERLAILQKSTSRGRSVSPSRFRERSGSPEGQDLKWLITSHDPLERLDRKAETNYQLEEEHISDDDDGEKFQYDDTGNILPNYACGDAKIDEVLTMLENATVKDNNLEQLEALNASERALANAQNVGSAVDGELLRKVELYKQELTGNDSLDLSSSSQDADVRRQKLEQYLQYRRKVIEKENEEASGTLSPTKERNDDVFMVPYTSAIEDKLDSQFALQLNETIKEGKVDSSLHNSRVIQTITRGSFFQILTPGVKPKMFIACIDFSPELIFALEWCLGTVLVDGLVLFVVCVVEDNDANHHFKGNNTEQQREQQRLELLAKARKQVLSLLQLTKLQIHVVIEIDHHPIPRHLILELIDNLQPTLLVVGLKGQLALKGVLLGSLLNYLVTKLLVPVMVVREKLKKINRFKSGSLIFTNNIKPLTLLEARID